MSQAKASETPKGANVKGFYAGLMKKKTKREEPAKQAAKEVEEEKS